MWSFFTAASATFALNAGVWFRRARLFIVAPDSQAKPCLPSGRDSTYRPVQKSGASSTFNLEARRRFVLARISTVACDAHRTERCSGRQDQSVLSRIADDSIKSPLTIFDV